MKGMHRWSNLTQQAFLNQVSRMMGSHQLISRVDGVSRLQFSNRFGLPREISSEGQIYTKSRTSLPPMH